MIYFATWTVEECEAVQVERFFSVKSLFERLQEMRNDDGKLPDNLSVYAATCLLDCS